MSDESDGDLTFAVVATIVLIVVIGILVAASDDTEPKSSGAPSVSIGQ